MYFGEMNLNRAIYYELDNELDNCPGLTARTRVLQKALSNPGDHTASTSLRLLLPALRCVTGTVKMRQVTLKIENSVRKTVCKSKIQEEVPQTKTQMPESLLPPSLAHNRLESLAKMNLMTLKMNLMTLNSFTELRG
eukprot:Selendium_serpulae@DN6424_c0_g1_i6.p1